MVSGRPNGSSERLLRIEEIEAAEVALLRRLTPAERVVRGLRMGVFARRVIEASVRGRHPGWGEDEILRETLRRFAGE